MKGSRRRKQEELDESEEEKEENSLENFAEEKSFSPIDKLLVRIFSKLKIYYIRVNHNGFPKNHHKY